MMIKNRRQNLEKFKEILNWKFMKDARYSMK